MKQEIISYT